MLNMRHLVFLFSLIIVGYGALVDNLKKCSIKDDDCINDVYQTILLEAAASGFPEFGVPPLDPLEVKDLSLTILDTVNYKVVNGTVKGVKKIDFKSTHVDLDKFVLSQEILWESLTFKNTFLLSGSHPIFQSFLGLKTINGEGNSKIKFENVKVSLVIPFKIARNESGSTYFNLATKPKKAEFSIEKLSLAADKIEIDKKEMSKMIVPYFNSNWQANIKTLGKTFMDLVSDIYVGNSNKILASIPSSNFISDDLSPYVGKE